MLMFAQHLVKANKQSTVRSGSARCQNTVVWACVNKWTNTAPSKLVSRATAWCLHHHALLIARISPEPSVISPEITVTKWQYSNNLSYLLNQPHCLYCFEDYLLCSRYFNLGTSKQEIDMSKTMHGIKEGRPHPAVGRGISTQVLRTEYQVPAGKTFVVLRWGIGVFDLDLLDCLWSVATHHLLQLSMYVFALQGNARATFAFYTSINNFSLPKEMNWYFSMVIFIPGMVALKWIFVMH